jgi:hypothetical protein
MSSTSMVVVAARTYHQHPLGCPPSTSSTSVVAAASRTRRQHPQGGAIDVLLNLLPAARIFLATSTRGHRGKHYRYKPATWRKNGGKSFSEKFPGPCGVKNPGIIIPLQRISPNQRKRYDIIKLLE